MRQHFPFENKICQDCVFGTVVYSSVLSNCSFKGTSFCNTKFVNIDFSHSDFSNTDLRGCIFYNCDISQAKFEGVGTFLKRNLLILALTTRMIMR